MSGGRVERRLAAVLAADVAGYSRLMGADEVGTLKALKALRREIVDPNIAAHNGRIVKTTGDGLLVEFASAVDAVTCAMAVQDKIAERNVEASPQVVFRIGINVGDIIVDAGDIFGDGVNVAARLEALADPGGILISSKVLGEVEGKLNAAFEDRGDRHLKNIARPVRTWAVTRSGADTQHQRQMAWTDPSSPPPLPDKPSIAVLPFQNMSGDLGQEYLADGMVEEIITALSRFKWLFVIARNSTFTFKNKTVDIKEIGRTLGVHYVLEGSVRKSSGKVRITGQLIDATTGAHVWADRFEKELHDVFALQDEVADAVVRAIRPKLLNTEIGKARRRPGSLSAYDLYLKAMHHYYLMTREGFVEAHRLALRALELDPHFGFSAAVAAGCHTCNVIFGYASDPEFERSEALRLVRQALSIDDTDPDTLAMAAVVFPFMAGDAEAGMEFADRAVALNPNSFIAWNTRGWAYKSAARHEEAIRSYEHAIRVSPVDPMLYQVFAGMGLDHIELGQFKTAVTAGRTAQRQNPSYSTAYCCLVAAYAHLGQGNEAQQVAAQLRQIDPGFSISGWIARSGGRTSAKLVAEGLRKAGLPE